ncbi:GIY-YIG nuclease family protein [Agrococcus baldri]|uniref:GIY-YIG domain-containing protein n=1 Tax=Agrococcus baldri TaxID=153730 RepID=A0AA87RIK5_9MICO|nr:GIY-YIG nuclease family protein [Agrococcus baldri]GEK80920.1 hypothetical protein ABA31_22710 [Agrococcus baldri]
MPWTYLLRCADDSFYVGSTGRTLESRLQEHADGVGAEYTKRRLPVQLAWAGEFASTAEAYAMERRVHGWSRVKKEALIADDWEGVRAAARRRGVPKVRRRV